MTRLIPIRTVLNVQSSARQTGSMTRTLSKEFIEQLRTTVPGTNVIERDLYHGTPFVDEDWINASFTPDAERTAEHTAILGFSNDLIDELEQADLLVVGAPIYNFSVPAILKAWIDQAVRARRTFAYGPNGPVGLLKDKRAIIVTASGGVATGSEADFATGYLKHIINFVGITDVTLIAADQNIGDEESTLNNARSEIIKTIDRLSTETNGVQ